MEERPPVLAVRAPVDLEHQRMQLAGVEVRRLVQPALDHPPVGRRELVALRLGDVAIAQPGVEVRQARLRALREDMQLTRAARIGGGKRDDPGRDVEVEDASLAAHLRADVALEVGGVHPGHPGAAGAEEDAISLRGPAHARVVSGPHVGDHGVVHRQIEVGRQAARALAGQRHDPQPFEEPGVQPVGGEERDQIAAGRPRRRAELEPAAQVVAAAGEVDHVKVQLALEVGAGLGVARDHQAQAVGRPVEPGHVPSAARQLGGGPAGRGDHEEMVIATVDEALPVVLVVEAARDPGDRRATHLLAALGRPGVVDHAFGIGEHHPDERDPRPVRRPGRPRHALRNVAELADLPSAREVLDEQLVRRPDLADEGEAAPVGGPLGGMVFVRGGRRLDLLLVEQAPDHDAAPVLARARVRPPEAVGDALAVAAQPDVVDPAKTIKVFGANRARHGVNGCYQQPAGLR